MQIVIAILAFGLLVFVHEFGHFITAKLTGVRVTEFAIGMGPKLFSFGKGETKYALRLLPIGGSCAMQGEDASDDDSGDKGKSVNDVIAPQDGEVDKFYDPKRSFNNKPIRVRLLILVAGSVMNLLMGFILLLCIYAPAQIITIPKIDRFADQYVETGLGGIQVGDEILSINGENVYIASDVGMLLERYSGKPYTISLDRAGQRVTLENVSLSPTDLTFDGEAFHGYGLRYEQVSGDFLLSCKTAVMTGVDFVRLVRMGLADLFTGKVGVDQMSGPVGITAMMGDAAAEQNYTGLIQLVAFISINLGVMNLLPLPALDGGRILFLAVEFVMRLFKKKRLNPRVEGYVHLAGLVAFFALIIYVTVNDIIRIVS